VSDVEDKSVSNLQLKWPRLQSDWKWENLTIFMSQIKYHFLVTVGI
jgi:hypothetical protein